MIARNGGRTGGRRTPWRSVIAVTALALLLASCAAHTSSMGNGPSAAPTSPVVTSSPSKSHTGPTPSVTPATWRMLPQAPIAGMRPGSPAQAVWDGTEMLIVTSRWTPDKRSCMEVGVAYNPATDSWRSLPQMPHTGDCGDPLMTDRAVWTGKELLLWGTANAAFNPETNRWRRLPDPPTGTGGPAFAVWTGRQMIGWGGGGGDLLLNDGAAYTPATNTWKLLPRAPLQGRGRRDAAGVWTGTEMIVAGGFAPTSRGQRVFSDAAAYDPRTNTWRTLVSMPVAEWSGSAVWGRPRGVDRAGHPSGYAGPRRADAAGPRVRPPREPLALARTDGVPEGGKCPRLDGPPAHRVGRVPRVPTATRRDLRPGVGHLDTDAGVAAPRPVWRARSLDRIEPDRLGWPGRSELGLVLRWRSVHARVRIVATIRAMARRGSKGPLEPGTRDRCTGRLPLGCLNQKRRE